MVIGEKTTIYRGQWFNDLKHGIGEEDYQDNLVMDKFNSVRGIWFHHQLNGVAMLTGDIVGCCEEKDKTICFKDGMPIDMTKGAVKWTFYLYIFFCIVCIAAIVVSIVIDILYIIPAAIVFYWIMTCRQQPTHYIWNNLTLDNTYQNLDNCIKQRPEVIWHIQCYHYENKTYKSNGKTKTKRVKVKTHSAKG